MRKYRASCQSSVGNDVKAPLLVKVMARHQALLTVIYEGKAQFRINLVVPAIGLIDATDRMHQVLRLFRQRKITG